MTEEIYYDEDRNVIPKPIDTVKVLDAYNNELQSGDTVIAIKPLPVKKWTDIKQGEKFTKIKLTDDPELILAKHPKNGEIYLRTEFFKKA